MRKSKRGIGVFFISLAISFIILISIFLLFFIYKKSNAVDNRQENVPYDIAEYSPREQDSLTFLIIGCDEPADLPTLFLLARYDAIEGTINLKVIPPQTQITYQTRKDTLQGHYDYEGILGATRAVKSLTLQEVDRYIRLDKVGIANLIDMLGGIEYCFENEFSCGEYTFLKGEQLLDGQRAAEILLTRFENSNDVLLQTDLSKSLLRQRLNSELIDNFPTFQSAFFYNAQTNLNSYDFAFRQKGIFSRLKSATLVISDEIIQGVYEYDNGNKVFVVK